MPTPNNTYYWTGSGSLNTLTNWTPTVPSGQLNENNLFVFSGSQSAPTSATATFGSWQFDANFNAYTEIGGAFLLRAGNFSQGAYTLYVGDGKVVASTAAGVQYLLHNGSGRNELWAYIGSGAEYRTMSYYGTAGGGARVRIFGPGKFYFAYNAPSGQTQPNAVGVTIDTGTAAVRGTDYATNTAGNPWGTGTLAFVSGSSRLNIESGGGSRSFSNPVSFPSGATFQIDSGSGITFSNVTSSGGTVTIAGTGSTTFTQALTIPGIAFTANGTLNLAANSTVSTSMTGSAGTLNANNCTISADAPSFTGTVNGYFTYNGVGTMRGNVAGTARVNIGSVSFTNPANGGYLQLINDATVTFNGGYFGGSGDDGQTGYWVNIRGNADPAVRATVKLVGPAAGCHPARRWSVRNNSQVILTQGATLNSSASTGGFFTDTAEPNPPTPVITSDDTNTNTVSANFYPLGNSFTAGNPGITNFVSRTGGTLVLSGTLYANWPGGPGLTSPIAASGQTNYTFNATKPYYNISAPDADYSGTIQWTGTCNGSVSLFTLARGTLHINSTSTTNLAAGLTVSSGAKLACSSTGLYAAQLSGPVTLASGSTFRFGAPA